MADSLSDFYPVCCLPGYKLGCDHRHHRRYQRHARRRQPGRGGMRPPPGTGGRGMKGTGRVELNGAAVYGPYAAFAGMVRVCVPVDECDRLGLTEGMWVRVGLPGADPVRVLLVKAL